MERGIAHGWEEETLEAKARWFQSLSVEERMNMMVSFTNLILENNPDIVNKKHARPITARVQILEL